MSLLKKEMQIMQKSLPREIFKFRKTVEVIFVLVMWENGIK